MDDDLFAAFSAKPEASTSNIEAAAASTSTSRATSPAHSTANEDGVDGGSRKSGKRRKRKNRDRGSVDDTPKKAKVEGNGASSLNGEEDAPLGNGSAHTASGTPGKVKKEQQTDSGQSGAPEGNSVVLPEASTSKTVNARRRDAKIELQEPLKEQPLVADDFEQEATVAVAASAGLQGGAATAADAESGGKITLSHQVRHQVAVPPGYPYVPIAQHVPPPVPARVYPFELDPFQKVSVASIERNESVLVSAHTSAGKTVVAEYAIAQCLRDKQRVIYTSPIKVSCNRRQASRFTETLVELTVVSSRPCPTKNTERCWRSSEM